MENNEVLTKILGALHFQNRETLFTALGNGEVTLPQYLVKMLRPVSSSLISKILRPLKGNKGKEVGRKQRGCRARQGSHQHEGNLHSAMWRGWQQL